MNAYTAPGVSIKHYNSINELETAVCNVFEVGIDELRAKTRVSHITNARKALYYVNFIKGIMSSNSLARRYGYTHASVLFGIKKCQYHMETEPEYKHKINQLL
jgi:chromosomal replication initiation ATPase DnaA